MAKEVKKVAFLTAGGLAPCLSSSIGFLIDEYNKKVPQATSPMATRSFGTGLSR